MEKVTFENNLEPLLGPSAGKNQVQEGQEKSFGEVMMNSIDEVSRLKKEADQAVQDLAVGKGGIHETMIAMEKAGISFQFASRLIFPLDEITASR